MTATFGFNFSDTYSQLPKEFVKKAELYSFENPQHQIFNSSLALSLGLDEKTIKKVTTFSQTGTIFHMDQAQLPKPTAAINLGIL